MLVHYAADAAWARPLLDTVYASLTEAGLVYAPLGGVVPNPRLHKVYEGIELGRREKVDFILAVGGGSVIDSAKAIGYGLMDDGDVWDFYIRKRTPRACMPVGVILTLAATGSETSDGSVITNEYGHPHDDTLSRLRDADVTVYRTDLNGTIVCRSDGVNLTFTTEKEG